MNFIKRLFKKIFGVKEPIYDESSDCFFAAQFWVKKYNKEKEELRQLIGEDRTYGEELVQSKQKKKLKQINNCNNAQRYSLNYLYKHNKR